MGYCEYADAIKRYEIKRMFKELIEENPEKAKRLVEQLRANGYGLDGY